MENPACVWVYFKIIIKSLEKMNKVCYKLLLSMVGVAQLVEHLVVAQDAVGSSPITHPIRKLPVHPQMRIGFVAYAPVAQLDRAPDFESVGRGFESLRACHSL